MSYYYDYDEDEEDIVCHPLSGVSFKLSDGASAYIRNVDEWNHRVYLDDESLPNEEEELPKSLSYEEFAHLDFLSPLEDKLRLFIQKIKTQEIKANPGDILPLIKINPTQEDLDRNEALGKTTVLSKDYDPKAIYCYGKKYLRPIYIEKIGSQYLLVLEKAPFSIIPMGLTPKGLLRECNALSYHQDTECYEECPEGIKVHKIEQYCAKAFPELKRYVNQSHFDTVTSRHNYAMSLPSWKDELPLIASTGPLDEETLEQYKPLIMKAINARAYKYKGRGKKIFEQGDVIEIRTRLDSSLLAIVLSSNGKTFYHVRAKIGKRGIETDCDCPFGEDHSFCKHGIALLYALANYAGLYLPYDAFLLQNVENRSRGIIAMQALDDWIYKD